MAEYCTLFWEKQNKAIAVFLTLTPLPHLVSNPKEDLPFHFQGPCHPTAVNFYVRLWYVPSVWQESVLTSLSFNSAGLLMCYFDFF